MTEEDTEIPGPPLAKITEFWITGEQLSTYIPEEPPLISTLMLFNTGFDAITNQLVKYVREGVQKG